VDLDNAPALALKELDQLVTQAAAHAPARGQLQVHDAPGLRAHLSGRAGTRLAVPRIAQRHGYLLTRATDEGSSRQKAQAHVQLLVALVVDGHARGGTYPVKVRQVARRAQLEQDPQAHAIAAADLAHHELAALRAHPVVAD